MMDINYLFSSWVYLSDLSELNHLIEKSYSVINENALFNSGEHTLLFTSRSESGLNLIGAEKQIERLDNELELIQEKVDECEDRIFNFED